MRWTTTLESAVLQLDDKGEAELQLGSAEDGRRATVRISKKAGRLAFEIQARLLRIPKTLPPFPEWYFRAHAIVNIDPHHDHATRWSYAIDDTGSVHAKSEWVMLGEEPSDNCISELPPPPQAAATFTKADAGAERYTLEIPLPEQLPAGPLGFSIKVGAFEAIVRRPLQWPETEHPDVPMYFGDLFLKTPDIVVRGLHTQRPCWSPLRTVFTLSGESKLGKLRVHCDAVVNGETCSPCDGGIESGPFRRDIEMSLPDKAKWVPEQRETAMLRIRICDEQERPRWTASYPFGFDAGIIVRDRFGGARAPRPDPNSKDFVQEFRRYVLTRIPDYVPTERAYVYKEPGGDALDLCAPDALQQVAKLLSQRFDDWQDALCAAAMWVYHPLILRHSATWARVAGSATIESIPRLGGSFCDTASRLTAAMAELVGREKGVALTGYSMGLRGHLSTLVATPVGDVVIDGMIGVWFHTLDNKRLATLDEMRAERRIVERVWAVPRRPSHEFFFGIHDQIVRPLARGSLRWPHLLDK